MILEPKSAKTPNLHSTHVQCKILEFVLYLSYIGVRDQFFLYFFQKCPINPIIEELLTGNEQGAEEQVMHKKFRHHI